MIIFLRSCWEHFGKFIVYLVFSYSETLDVDCVIRGKDVAALINPGLWRADSAFYSPPESNQSLVTLCEMDVSSSSLVTQKQPSKADAVQDTKCKNSSKDLPLQLENAKPGSEKCTEKVVNSLNTLAKEELDTKEVVHSKMDSLGSSTEKAVKSLKTLAKEELDKKQQEVPSKMDSLGSSRPTDKFVKTLKTLAQDVLDVKQQDAPSKMDRFGRTYGKGGSSQIADNNGSVVTAEPLKADHSHNGNDFLDPLTYAESLRLLKKGRISDAYRHWFGQLPFAGVPMEEQHRLLDKWIHDTRAKRMISVSAYKKLHAAAFSVKFIKRADENLLEELPSSDKNSTNAPIRRRKRLSKAGNLTECENGKKLQLPQSRRKNKTGKRRRRPNTKDPMKQQTAKLSAVPQTSGEDASTLNERPLYDSDEDSIEDDEDGGGQDQSDSDSDYRPPSSPSSPSNPSSESDELPSDQELECIDGKASSGGYATAAPHADKGQTSPAKVIEVSPVNNFKYLCDVAYEPSVSRYSSTLPNIAHPNAGKVSNAKPTDSKFKFPSNGVRNVPTKLLKKSLKSAMDQCRRAKTSPASFSDSSFPPYRSKKADPKPVVDASVVSILPKQSTVSTPPQQVVYK